MTNTKCPVCSSSSLLRVPTYRRVWYLCESCGTGHPVPRQRYPLAFLPDPAFRKGNVTESSIYDYFIHPGAVENSIRTAHEFIRQYIDANGIDLRGKHLLDVSGGNGHFLKVFMERGATGVLTEFNQLAVDYAKKTHGIQALRFDFNSDRLGDLTQERFDIVMLRAAIMFCHDLLALVAEVRARLKPGGLVIVNHSVVPTLGVMVRVQLDEFSYAVLRQPETVVSDFTAAGFSLVSRRDETDPSLYVYEADLRSPWMFLHYLYEIRGALALRRHRVFAFPARDRRRSTMIFRAT